MDNFLQRIRRTIVVALFSDDKLVDQLVLKGGNALELAHKLISRGSVDLDFSLRNDFPVADLPRIEDAIRTALSTKFADEEFVLFDFTFRRTPAIPHAEDPMPWWGGYKIGFKLLSAEHYAILHSKGPQALSSRAQVANPRTQSRTFDIEISKHEAFEKTRIEVDGTAIWAYSLEAIAFEKLRAICQQMADHEPPFRDRKRARSRDFYDVASIIFESYIDLSLPENRELCKDIFAAKRVPLSHLYRVPSSEVFEFHRADWDATRENISSGPSDFEYYFDVVGDEVRRLEALWNK